MTVTPTIAELERIAQHHDLVLRNLLITDAYHRLSLAVRTGTGTGANWCTFATWASKQAGRTIRKEDLQAALRSRVKASPELVAIVRAALPALRQLGVLRTADALLNEIVKAVAAGPALTRAAQAVAEGNLKVFQEIALEFGHFLAAEADSDDNAFTTFLSRLRPGDPPDGQRLLADAFSAYHRALAETDPLARAQRLFYANLLIGLHEQTRLQPQIAAALNASFDQDEVKRHVVAAVLPGFWRTLRYRISALFGRRPPLDEVLDKVLPLVQQELRKIVTAEAMSLQFPGGEVVRLGRDVVGTFPPGLATISNAPLLALLQRVDRTLDSVAGSGARDWSVLEQRMHLIADLFRCRHEWEPLFQPPFTTAQMLEVAAGRRPAGPL